MLFQRSTALPHSQVHPTTILHCRQFLRKIQQYAVEEEKPQTVDAPGFSKIKQRISEKSELFSLDPFLRKPFLFTVPIVSINNRIISGRKLRTV